MNKYECIRELQERIEIRDRAQGKINKYYEIIEHINNALSNYNDYNICDVRTNLGSSGNSIFNIAIKLQRGKYSKTEYYHITTDVFEKINETEYQILKMQDYCSLFEYFDDEAFALNEIVDCVNISTSLWKLRFAHINVLCENKTLEYAINTIMKEKTGEEDDSKSDEYYIKILEQQEPFDNYIYYIANN